MGDLAFLRKWIEHSGNCLVYWNTPHGRFVLRYLASCSANNNLWDTVIYSCEARGVPVDAVQVEDGLWLMPGICPKELPRSDPLMTPLIGAICGYHEDLALHLLTVSEEALDLNRRVDIDKTIFHLCAESGLTRLLKELVRRGADFFPCDDMHHTPLCTAAMHAHLPLVRYILKQCKARGESELERALYYPCGKKGFEYSLLGHVCGGFGNPESLRRMATARYLVQEYGAGLWRPLEVHAYGRGAGAGGSTILALPLHHAAWHGSRELLALCINECNTPVDIVTTCLHLAPLYSLCMSRRDEAEVLRIVRFLVEQKGANLSLKTTHGETRFNWSSGRESGRSTSLWSGRSAKSSKAGIWPQLC